jgi:hypothetical protein
MATEPLPLPTNMEDAVKERLQLTKEIMDIQCQLAVRAKDAPGYARWRRMAIYVYTQKTKRAADLKQLIAQLGKDGDEPVTLKMATLLKRAFDALRAIQSESEVLTEHEHGLIEEIGRFFESESARKH